MWRALSAAQARETVCLAHCEHAQLLMLHRKNADAKLALGRAKQLLGLTFELGGALGKRTKHQENAISQLVLTPRHAAHALPRELEEDAVERARAAALPLTVVQEDDELLSKTELESEGEARAPPLPLTATEQTVLMAECAWVQADRPSSTETMEELETCVA